MFLKMITFLMPWSLRRRALNSWFKYQIHPKAKIGLAWVFPGKLVMGPGCRIEHFTVAIHLDLIQMAEDSTIGRGNWITGLSTKTASKHFSHQPDRHAELIVGVSTNITKKHHIDCTDRITIGAFCTVAGYHSQFLTHSLNLNENRQDSAPITIGDYTMVGTKVLVLPGATLPSYSVLAGASMLNKVHVEEWKIYAGIPAKPISDIPPTAKYFSRKVGFIY